MGWYSREGDDDLPMLAVINPDRYDQIMSLLVADHPDVSALPPAWHRRIACAACDSVATVVVAGGIDLVHWRMRLWRQGWRRDPDTQLDYCPTCQRVDSSPVIG